MKLIISGTAEFSDYSTFLRAMGVALSDVSSGQTLDIYSIAPHKINNFAIEFINKTERSLKQKNVSVKLNRIKEYSEVNANSIYFFCNEKQPLPKFIYELEGSGVEALVFRP